MPTRVLVVDDDWYIFTQFESRGARRAFPSFDQPDHKVPFTLRLEVPETASLELALEVLGTTDGSTSCTTTPCRPSGRSRSMRPERLELEGFTVIVDKRDADDPNPRCEASIRVSVGGQLEHTASAGNGPVNALDVALRKDLGDYQPYIQDLRLTDFKVRILDGGTGAVTRVIIESADDSGDVWTTVGVSPNIIDASFQALVDSVTFKLLKSDAPAP